MTPTISIGMPVYNASPAVIDALRGIQRQTFKDFEVIISDNSSTDNTGEICQAFCKDDSRFRYVRQDQNIGMVANFEFVLKEAKAPYFLWRAYDDYSSDNYLEVLLSALKDTPRAILAVTDTHWWSAPEDYEKWFCVTNSLKTNVDRAVFLHLQRCCSGWFYGLYRRVPLISHWEYCRDNIGYSNYNGDLITMAKLVTEGRVVSVQGASMHHQRLTLKPSPLWEFSLDQRIAAFKLVWRVGAEGLDGLPISYWKKKLLRPMLLYFINKRIIKVKPLFREWVLRPFQGRQMRDQSLTQRR